jgi:diguanylate cyclase (GGDEF)-like protein
MGGDEFMLLLTDVKEAEDCMTIAGKIVESFQRPFFLDDHEVHVTTSVGIAIYPDDGQDFDALKKHADASMYKAKAMGRNNYQRKIRNKPLETANTSKHCQ